MRNYEAEKDRKADEKISFCGETHPKIDLHIVTMNRRVSSSEDPEQQNFIKHRWSSLTESCGTSSLNGDNASLPLPEPAEETKPKCESEEVYEADDEASNLLNWSIPKVVASKGTIDTVNEVTKTLISESKISLKSESPSGESMEKKWKRKLADYFFTIVVVSPMVVGHWQGYWAWMDTYFRTYSTWDCFFLGFGLHTIFAVFQSQLNSKFAGKSRVRGSFCRIMYTYLFSTGCIAQWRGGWTIFDYHIAYTWMLQPVTVICLLILAGLRSIRNLVASPFIITIDNPDYVFKFRTRFNTNTRDWTLYIMDCAFSVGVVGTLVVFVWRGVWVSFDLYLFPSNAGYSAVGSVVIGYTIVVITFSMQPLMRWACARLEGIPRLIVADLFMLLSFIGTINVWRGVWNCLGLWFLPEDPELSCWITHFGCFMFLVLLNCSNSILVRGVLIDAEEADGKCVVFPCHYLRLFFKIEREKKEARRQNLVVASRDLATIIERPGKEGNGSVLNAPDPLTVVESTGSSV